MAAVLFNPKLTRQLIQLVKEHPMLYDSNDPNYSELEEKQQAWKEIGKQMQRPPHVCKQRWVNVRDMMRKTIKNKLKYPNRKGYKFERDMEFMIPYFKEFSVEDCTEEYLEQHEDSDNVKDRGTSEEEKHSIKLKKTDYKNDEENTLPSNMNKVLIKLVKENPCLWDSKNPESSSLDIREVIWQEISDNLGYPVQACRLRWNNLRDNYRRRLRTRGESYFKSGRSYKYKDELSFLKKQFKSIKATNQDLEMTIGDEELGKNDYEEDNDDEIDMSVEPYEMVNTLEYNSLEQDHKPQIQQQNKEDDLNITLDANDPVDVFLLAVGSTLKSLNPYYRNQAKTKIFQVAQEYELKQMMEEKQGNHSKSDSII